MGLKYYENHSLSEIVRSGEIIGYKDSQVLDREELVTVYTKDMDIAGKLHKPLNRSKNQRHFVASPFHTVEICDSRDNIVGFQIYTGDVLDSLNQKTNYKDSPEKYILDNF